MEKKTTYYIYLFVIFGMCLLLTNACKKKDKEENDPLSNTTTGTVTDIDGNTYKTIKIGNQWWMAENLKTTKFNDGIAIPFINDSIIWSNLYTPAYCWYNDNQATYGNNYGALYNWFVINTGKLCPSGWHVPTDSDWETLISFLGGENVAGGKLKETGFTHWLNPNKGATNETVFTALPGGYRYYNGTFFGEKCGGFWWSASEINEYQGSYWYMFYLDSSIRILNNYKRSGLSVRCVKD